MQNFRHFQAGPDPWGRVWQVDLLWLQTAISIRHSDSVDVKFLLQHGDVLKEVVVSLPHADLLALSKKTGRPLTDPWCMKLAALHLAHIIESGEDFEKKLVTVFIEDLEKYNAALEKITATA
jgi:hypothetical protein